MAPKSPESFFLSFLFKIYSAFPSTRPNVTKHFTTVIYEFSYKPRGLVLGKILQSSLTATLAQKENL
jgi:hypothetical protein